MVAYHREWRSTPDGRAKMRAGVTASRNRYPERQRARHALHQAILRGEVVPGPCYVGEGCSGQIEGHHDDYSRPLDVIWACRRHHRVLDRKRREVA